MFGSMSNVAKYLEVASIGDKLKGSCGVWPCAQQTKWIQVTCVEYLNSDPRGVVEGQRKWIEAAGKYSNSLDLSEDMISKSFVIQWAFP